MDRRQEPALDDRRKVNGATYGADLCVVAFGWLSGVCREKNQPERKEAEAGVIKV